MFLRYEDLLADAPASVKKIADFVGIETTPEIMEKVGEFLNEGVFFLCVLYSGRKYKNRLDFKYQDHAILVSTGVPRGVLR